MLTNSLEIAVCDALDFLRFLLLQRSQQIVPDIEVNLRDFFLQPLHPELKHPVRLAAKRQRFLFALQAERLHLLLVAVLRKRKHCIHQRKLLVGDQVVLVAKKIQRVLADHHVVQIPDLQRLSALQQIPIEILIPQKLLLPLFALVYHFVLAQP